MITIKIRQKNLFLMKHYANERLMSTGPQAQSTLKEVLQLMALSSLDKKRDYYSHTNAFMDCSLNFIENSKNFSFLCE